MAAGYSAAAQQRRQLQQRDMTCLSEKLAFDVANSNGHGQSPASFMFVSGAGTIEANGLYKCSGRQWLQCEVLQNVFSPCIVSREAQTKVRTGEQKHGFMIGLSGRPLYGAPSESMQIPSKGWRTFQGATPIPQIQIFTKWSAACESVSKYFENEAAMAADCGHWENALLFIDRAISCHNDARPKGSADCRHGREAWANQYCELLALKADALLHLHDYRAALLSACAAVHFVAAFEWTKARTRGIAACLNLGVEESQAKLLMEDASQRGMREFQGVNELSPWVDDILTQARAGKLTRVVLNKPTFDDGRLYFCVADPEDCKVYAAPDLTAHVLGKRSCGAIVRGERLHAGEWLELHVAEAYDDRCGHQTAFIPLFSSVGENEEERDEILTRCPPEDHPSLSRWETLGLKVKPLGLKPPTEEDAPLEHCRWKDESKPRNQQEWPYIYKHQLAVVTMLRGAPECVIDSFVRYHWGIGFNHIFLFFDDPDDPGIELAKEFEEMCATKQVEGVSISVYCMDSAWWARARVGSRFYQRREKSDFYDFVCKGVDNNDVEAKQIIVLDMAIWEAHEMGIDWFVPLDIDECFYVKQEHDCSARRYLCSKSRSVQCIRLWNHEAVPERDECEDWFRECTLFFANLNHCHGFTPPREYDELLRQQEGREFEPEALDPDASWWSDLSASICSRRQQLSKDLGLELPPATASRTAAREPWISAFSSGGSSGNSKSAQETFFYFTSNADGRCAVRLEQRLKPPLPYGSRGFLADSGDMLRECYQANSPSDAVILHYANPGLSYWRRKYNSLGDISIQRCAERSLPRFHLASSQVVLHCDKHAQERFYSTFVMQNEHNELALLAEHGLLIRVEGVRSLLLHWDAPPEPEELLPGQQRWVHPSGLQLAAPGDS